MDFRACVYVQQQTLGTHRYIELSKHIQTYHREAYADIKYESVHVKPNKYVHTLINTLSRTN